MDQSNVEGVGRRKSCTGSGRRKDSSVLAGRRREKKKSLIITRSSNDTRRSIITRPKTVLREEIDRQRSIDRSSEANSIDGYSIKDGFGASKRKLTTIQGNP